MLYKDHFNTFLAPADDGGGNTADGAGADGDTATNGGDDQAATTTGGETTDEKTFTQAELETVLADRLARQENKLRRDVPRAMARVMRSVALSSRLIPGSPVVRQEFRMNL